MSWYVRVLKKYAEFNGRARRTEYWTFFLVNFVVTAVLGFLEGLVGGPGILALLYGLAVLVPTLAVGLRRLHDTDRSGWWTLIAFVPVIGAIVLLVFLIQDGQQGANRYGPDPKQVPA